MPMTLERDFALESYDYDYPEELVAQAPEEPRDACRLLVLDRAQGSVLHARFREIGSFLRPGDCLVLNRTKVWPARLSGRKATGGKAEMLLVRELEAGRWTALASGLKPGMRISFSESDYCDVETLNEEGEYVCRFSSSNVSGLMERLGLAPVPPYILHQRKRSPSFVEAPRGTDLERYQTVYAREQGSIAAPTAGMHFTPELLKRLESSGISIAELVLHVGRGTFRPVVSQDVREHRMLPEWYQVSPQALKTIAAARARGGRVLAVGTTATRTLEALALRESTDASLDPRGAEGWTDLLLHPGHEFRSIHGLLTNFHQPRSTPLLLASAFAGRERLLSAYREAVALRYRLYSYGDAMLIL